MVKKQQPNLLEIIIISLLKGLWFLVGWPIKKIFKLKTRNSKLDKVANLKKWMEINKLLRTNDEIHAKQAIIDADKFFDDIMKQLGVKGEGFADRLRSLENKMDRKKYQQVWEAHKIRNQISHEMNYQLSNSEAKKALDDFRAGLHNLGAI